MNGHTLNLLSGRLAICRLDPTEPIPDWATRGAFCAISRTPEELSVLCSEEGVPPGVRRQGDWRALQVEGPLDFGQVGVLASLAGTLAAAGIAILAISTFDTDYVLVQDARLESALAALSSAGNRIHVTDHPRKENYVPEH